MLLGAPYLHVNEHHVTQLLRRAQIIRFNLIFLLLLYLFIQLMKFTTITMHFPCLPFVYTIFDKTFHLNRSKAMLKSRVVDGSGSTNQRRLT